MNETHEPSYYEIALTNRQVLVAFVVLLVCLVAAFFSGVWVGRGNAATEQQVRAAAPAPASDTGQPLEEFKFFTDQKAAPGEAKADAGTPREAATPPRPTAVAQAHPDTTLLQDLGGAKGAPASGSSAAPSEDREEPAAAAESGAAPAATPPAAPAPGSVPASSPAAASAAAEPAAGPKVIQVFSTSDQEQARRVMNRLVRGGFKAFLSPVTVGKQTMYRVRVGPFDERSEAEKVAEQVKKRFKLDTWITSS